MKKALTGIQPTNLLHIGNYFGALLPAVKLQEEYQVYMMIADLHAITVPQDPQILKKNILFGAAAYLAAGIDPEKTVLFQQSRVPEHAELGWVMQTLTMMGEANRMTQFKDKSAKNEKGVSVGLFTYPALMAADILLYDANAVPVGEDQKQHLELARNLAERFNNRFGKTFTVPEPIIGTSGARIKSLKDPSKKMSKSDPSAKSYISIMDDADLVQKKIRSAMTDSNPTITADKERHGLYNLLTLFSLATGKTQDEIAIDYRDNGMRELKDGLTEALEHILSPLQMQVNQLLDQEDELLKIVKQGSEKAHHEAHEKLQGVYKIMGLKID